MRILGVLLFAALPALAWAQSPASPEIMTDVYAGHFDAASALAAATGDPLTQKLVTFFRLLDPGGGTPDEIRSFIAENPDWPEQGLLALRARQAEGIVSRQAPEVTPPFLQQVEALHAAGQDEAAATLWTSQGKAAAGAADAGQLLMFWPAQNELARALLAAGDAKSAYQVVIAVNPPIAGETAREQIADRDFLAGFLLLRFLHEPEEAATWFRDLSTSSTAVITQARAWYWLGRSESGAAAQADFARAAQYPDTYYGQLAALALGDTPQQLAQRILSAGQPPFSAGQALDFALMELPRAAVLLMQMNDQRDAMIFLNRIGAVAADDRTRELAARLALGLGLPSSAVSIARTAGVAGQMLVREGWPMPVTPPDGDLPGAIAFGIMRQESSFNPDVVSGAGAVGLMQLMPATARHTARKDGISYSNNLFDPHENMLIGSAYIDGLIKDFGNCLPLAIAAYNAGPTNVANWLASNGDPELGTRAGGADIIDWVEEIPFNETRNYVQRVTESIVVYQALLHGTTEHPLVAWMQK
ncbi:MAG TPA: lytic transglycosylase domain-containing protein [Acidocella sp.]|jgi:soluble lytic murein transglycosylase|uniref:lytic transglycosylase domain-containing protein n=1 Tax=Acidocella sp. TaxID=50710 RepID=UPI002C705A17|nr:lytic transglycosylase domain-containing protein [Acidocella sp.]HVE23650.1 lytic transglycosylase domain-containing protein [Acidocella sp.]